MSVVPVDGSRPAGSTYPARRVRRLDAGCDARPVRVVHGLDGIDQEVSPDTFVGVGRVLWDRWRASRWFRAHDLVLGLDAGGIVPALGVALASGAPYRLAWKVNLDLPDKRMFREPYARRLEVFTYGRLAGLSVLVVDDEVTSGATVGDLIRVLREDGVEVVGVACLVEDTCGNGRQVLEEAGVPLCALRVL